MSKVLGILGGMGSMATVELFRRIVSYTDASCDQEHLEILIYNKSSIPDRTNYILTNENDPRSALMEGAKRLQNMGAEYLIMPCNTAHYFYKDIKKEIDIPFLSMVEESAKYIKKYFPYVEKVGLLSTKGTYKARVYYDVFSKYDIEVVNPEDRGRDILLDLIYDIKRGEYPENLDKFNEALEEVKKKGAQLYVLACTELSLIYKRFNLDNSFLDSLEVLALKAIEYGGKEVKSIK